MRLLFIISLVGLNFIVLSQPKSGIVDNTYHNVTARYNSYFIARERIREIEATIYEQYDWNYSDILEIFPQFDTTTSKSLETLLQDCIEKASMAIQRHPESRWEDDAYILVGIARLYGSEFPEAIETFKYVNTNGDAKNSKHAALVNLLRTFTEAKEYKNAIAVSDYLRKQEMSTENFRNYYLSLAYYFQKRKDFNLMVQNLVLAEELMTSGGEKARIDFIIGQVYQHLGFEANAYEYYKSTLKHSKSYELTFFTKLNMAQVTQLSNVNNTKKIHKYFRKLLNDPKNLEYKDRIYFEIGDFELKRGNIDAAIENYKYSISSNTNNKRQKSYSYLKLGQIYYDSLKDFELAKAYYDSTINILSTDEENYEIVKTRQEVLDEFVSNLKIIYKNDSLISLTKLSKDSLDLLMNFVIDRKESEFLSNKERKKKERRQQQNALVSNYNEDNQVIISQTITGQWYFYNNSVLSQGLSSFRQKWGDRTLEDNWRRSEKSINTQSNLNTLSSENNVKKRTQDDADNDSEIFNRSAEKSKLIAGIPASEQEIKLLQSEIEVAYYNLGNIYNFKLGEKENSITSFNKLLLLYPDTEFKPEVLYQLFLLNKEINIVASNQSANILLEEFPESIYAKLIFNPNYREESKALNEKLKKIYRKAYWLYVSRELEESYDLIDSALTDNPQSEFAEYLSLLRAMVLGKLDGIYKYQYELNNFIRNNPESQLITYAKKLVKASEDFQINLFSASRAKFIRNFEEKHYFIFIYSSKPELSEEIPDKVSTFIKENEMDLNTGNLVFDEKHSMVLVNELSGKHTANSFLEFFEKSLKFSDDYKGEIFYPLVITKENFDILYETKDLDSYLTFFENNYP